MRQTFLLEYTCAPIFLKSLPNKKSNPGAHDSRSCVRGGSPPMPDRESGASVPVPTRLRGPFPEPPPAHRTSMINHEGRTTRRFVIRHSDFFRISSFGFRISRNWYSRPELNGDRRFRKPLLYPF